MWYFCRNHHHFYNYQWIFYRYIGPDVFVREKAIQKLNGITFFSNFYEFFFSKSEHQNTLKIYKKTRTKWLLHSVICQFINLQLIIYFEIKGPSNSKIYITTKCCCAYEFDDHNRAPFNCLLRDLVFELQLVAVSSSLILNNVWHKLNLI